MPKTDNESTDVVKFSNELVRPQDITDAVDSRDLLDQILTSNIKAITFKVEARAIKARLADEKKRLRSQYFDKAQVAYDKMWAICSSKTVGHTWRNVGIRVYTINQCDDCKMAYVKDGSATKHIAQEMNDAQITALTDRMIELDIEAGIFAWPTEQDYPNIKKSQSYFAQG